MAAKTCLHYEETQVSAARAQESNRRRESAGAEGVPDVLTYAEARRVMSDYLSLRAVQDPYPMFRVLRETEPVHRSHAGVWLVLAEREASELFRSKRVSRRAQAAREFAVLPGNGGKGARSLAQEMLLSQFINYDGEDHARMRRLVARAFGPTATGGWRPVTERVMDAIAEELREKDEFDLLWDLAYPLPERVICEMVGVPHADHALWETWTRQLTDVNRVVDEDRSATFDAAERFADYFSRLIQDRRRNPGDDLLTMLLRAEDEGRRLSHTEVLATMMLLISAGHETTANLIGNGTLALLRNPDQMQALRDDPSLLPAAVEELLRFESPARSLPRMALEDVPLGDAVIPAGETVQVLLGAVNRDPSFCPDPDTPNVRRKEPRHLAFGAGPHYCLGAWLARMEAEVAFRTITTTLGPLELATDAIQWRASHVRALSALPVRRVR